MNKKSKSKKLVVGTVKLVNDLFLAGKLTNAEAISLLLQIEILGTLREIGASLCLKSGNPRR